MRHTALTIAALFGYAMVIAQVTKVNPIKLVAPSATVSRLLVTDAGGAVAWSNAQSILSAGTGISISGNTITNSLPDQTVVLTGSGSVAVTGSYPNFTISGTGGISGLTATRVPFASSATTLSDDANLLWDNTNKRLGIGTGSPTERLGVNGNVILTGPNTPTIYLNKQNGFDSSPFQLLNNGTLDFYIQHYNGGIRMEATGGANDMTIRTGLDNSRTLTVQSSNLKLRSGNAPYPYFFELGNNAYSPFGQDASLQTDLNMQFRGQYDHIQWPVNHAETGTGGAYWQMGRGAGNTDKWQIRIQQAGANSFSDAITLLATGTAGSKSFQYMGVGTASPVQTLHVAGTMRLTGSTGTATGLVGRDGNGDVSAVGLGSGLSMPGGTLTVAGLISGLTSPRIPFATGANSIGDDANLSWDNTNKRLSVGNTGGSPQASIHIAQGSVSSWEDLRAAGTVSGNMVTSFLNSFNTGGTGSQILQLSVGGASAGDPVLQWSVSGIGTWSAGVSNSQSDRFEIGYQSAPNQGAGWMTILTDGKVGIKNNFPTTDLSVSGVGSIEFPSGPTANRPDATLSQIRYNTTVKGIEVSSAQGIWSRLTSHATPVGTVSTGAGTGGTISFDAGANDLGGTVTISTGTTPAAGATVCTVTFNQAFASGGRVRVVLEPLNDSTVANRSKFRVGTITANSFTIVTVAGQSLPASTSQVLQFNYVITQ